MKYDVFVCHSGTADITVARPLSALLEEEGLSVWLDDPRLVIGDGIFEEINQSLLASRFGVVVLTPDFVARQWPQRELEAMFHLESFRQERMILPLWHGVDAKWVAANFPLLSDRRAMSSRSTLPVVASEIAQRVREANPLVAPDVIAELETRAAEAARFARLRPESLRITAQPGISIISSWTGEPICPRCHNPVEDAGSNHYRCDECALVFAAA